MRVYTLSGHPNKPCSILTFKSNTIMLDCGLDMTTALPFLPLPLVHSSRLSNLPSWTPRSSSDPQLEGELKECSARVFVDSSPEFCPPESGLIDFADIDVILISNYQSMMALPYITEHTGFKGFVYATEPTLQIGRQLMEELITYIERTPKIRLATRWKQPNVLKTLPPPLCDALKPRSWKQVYSAKDVNNSLLKVKLVGFSEKLDIYGALKISAISSGYCLGSCNWIIWSAHEKISYISASSTLTTHPKPMEHESLKNSDVIILTNLTQAPLANPDSMMSEICNTVAMTVKNGGSVLIPCYPSGVTFDLFECISNNMDSQSTIVPMYFLSPVADHSLAYSNILADWLSSSKQCKVYLPEEPFPHGHLTRTRRLRAYSSIKNESFSNEFSIPCIVFAGHPSLRFGDCVHFMELWGNSANNTLIFTEPDFPYTEAIAPYQPLAMKVMYYPIDTSLSFGQANKIIKESKPRHLLLPEQYTVISPLYRHREDLSNLVIESTGNTMPFKRGDVIKVPIKRTFERIFMTSEFAMTLVPVDVKPGLQLASIRGELRVKNNNYEIRSLPPTSEESNVIPNVTLKNTSHNAPKSYFYGGLDIALFIDKLNKAGIIAKTDKSPEGYIIDLPNDEILIRIEDHSTHILCAGNPPIRSKINKLLHECLAKF